jgi:hypothetical protein
MRIFTVSSNERSFPSFIVYSAAIFSNALLVSSLIFIVETMLSSIYKEYLLSYNYKVYDVYSVHLYSIPCIPIAYGYW